MNPINFFQKVGFIALIVFTCQYFPGFEKQVFACNVDTDCSSGEICCNNSCIDPQTDPANCLTCGTSCGVNSVCNAGVCRSICTNRADCNYPSEDCCDGICTSINFNSQNCFACGRQCGPGEVCGANGICANCIWGWSCSAGQTCCQGGCKNILSDPLNCGGCSENGFACSGGQVCENGVCTAPSGPITCNPSCTPGETCCTFDISCDMANNGGYCRAADNACHDLLTDFSNCGWCGKRCNVGETCSGGVCRCGSSVCPPAPPAPFISACCDGTCVNLWNNSESQDPNHCGKCGFQCLSGESCGNKTCQCDNPLCGGACVDFNSDSSNCGVCGNACAAGETCCSGNCVDLTGPANCGVCGNACAAGESCCSGTCTLGATCASSSCSVSNCTMGTITKFKKFTSLPLHPNHINSFIPDPDRIETVTLAVDIDASANSELKYVSDNTIKNICLVDPDDWSKDSGLIFNIAGVPKTPMRCDPWSNAVPRLVGLVGSPDITLGSANPANKYGLWVGEDNDHVLANAVLIFTRTPIYVPADGVYTIRVSGDGMLWVNFNKKWVDISHPDLVAQGVTLTPTIPFVSWGSNPTDSMAPWKLPDDVGTPPKYKQAELNLQANTPYEIFLVAVNLRNFDSDCVGGAEPWDTNGACNGNPAHVAFGLYAGPPTNDADPSYIVHTGAGPNGSLKWKVRGICRYATEVWDTNLRCCTTIGITPPACNYP